MKGKIDFLLEEDFEAVFNGFIVIVVESFADEDRQWLYSLKMLDDWDLTLPIVSLKELIDIAPHDLGCWTMLPL
jgi:hypothetical protein